jgi:hypothetical protein
MVLIDLGAQAPDGLLKCTDGYHVNLSQKVRTHDEVYSIAKRFYKFFMHEKHQRDQKKQVILCLACESVAVCLVCGSFVSLPAWYRRGWRAVQHASWNACSCEAGNIFRV